MRGSTQAGGGGGTGFILRGRHRSQGGIALEGIHLSDPREKAELFFGLQEAKNKLYKKTLNPQQQSAYLKVE